MGFYLKKSVRVGPLRFNLSKSGVGVSAGIKGLRFGSGPSGNYVHMGRGGIYYRKTFTAAPSYQQNNKPDEPSHTQAHHPMPQHATHAPLEDIESGTVFAMQDSSSSELLEEINSKRKKIICWPWVITIGVLVSVVLPWTWVGLVATMIITLWAYYYDQLRKTVVLFYELDKDIEPLYEALHHALDEMAASQKIWHIEAQGRVYDKKYHAGADNVIRRKNTIITKKAPPFLKTNISVPTIGAGKQTLYFFPDRLLVFENNAVGAIAYKDLRLNIYTNRFIEEESVPKDSEIIDRTWRYVNKNGGPDRRFSHNPQLPVVLYEYIDFISESGLNERMCLSLIHKGDFFAKAIHDLANSSK